MTEPKEITILGVTIRVGYDQMSISELRFLPDNPRVYAVTHGRSGFSGLDEEEQQEAIFRALCEESSFKNLKNEIKRHGGLIEPILVRADKQVIEGNSRLAVYRQLREEDEDGDWARIPCELIGDITDEQQAAYLQDVHVTGKASWSAYEKANYAYGYRYRKNWTVDKIAKTLGESTSTIRAKIKVVQMMADNDDTDKLSHFSYYEVLARQFPGTTKDVNGSGHLERLQQAFLERIKAFGTDDKKNEFTAQEMRKCLPPLIEKPRVAKKFIDGTLTLEDAWERARKTGVEVSIRRAFNALKNIERTAITDLDRGRAGAFAQMVRKAAREIERIRKIVESVRKR